MKRGYSSGFRWGFCFPPFDIRFFGPWGRPPWGMGFPRREDYLHTLEQYKEDLEEMQREISEELREVEQEIEKLKQE